MIKVEYIIIMKKSKTRLFIGKKLSLNMMIHIKEKQHHFLKNVLRCKINDEMILFDNQTGEWFAHIMTIQRDNTILKVSKKNKKLILGPDIWLFFAPIKHSRLNITIQKATELGVSKLIPIETSFTNNSSINYKNLNLNIIEAAEQCERLTLPILEKQIKFDKLISEHPKDRALIFCNESDKSNKSIFLSILKEKNNFKKWTLLIGPEGGFSDQEINKIKTVSNCISVTLGKRILRSDTATVASLFCLQSIIDSDNLS